MSLSRAGKDLKTDSDHSADLEKSHLKDEKLHTTHVQELDVAYAATHVLPLEEYLHQASLKRAEEHQQAENDPKRTIKETILHRSNINVPPFEPPRGFEITDLELEKINARRALRVAGWSSVFFLITTDILGPFNAPFALSQVGYVPGVILYFVMGIVALYTGLLLSHLFLKLDSDLYPIRTYGDIGGRLFGEGFRHFISVLQTLQLVVNVGTIVLSNGQSLSQITKNNLCFSVCIVIWALVGMVVGQIRTLKSYGWLANSAVWLNLLLIFVSMGVIANSSPNWKAAFNTYGISQGPIVTKAFVDQTLYNKINGIMNMIFAWGGAMIFPEIQSEMRRPWDFWKGMTCAQLLIFCAYLMYGIVVYHFQGQYTLPLAYQGISSYGWQTFGNILAIITGAIAAGLYGNIGIKIAYANIVEDWFHGPPLMSVKGHMIWIPLVVVYWALAFVIGSAIPQVQTITGLIAAVCILHFTYSFPPLFICAFLMMKDAAQADPEYIPGSGKRQRIDTWRSWSRWNRAIFNGESIFAKRFLFKLVNFIVFLGALSMAGLGMYGSGEAINQAFKVSAATSFGCSPPV